MKRPTGCLVLLVCALAARADDVLDIQAGVQYDSNVPRAQLAYDVKSDTALQAALSWGRFVPLADGLTLRATIDAGGAAYARYSGLDNVTLGASASVRQKFGLGALAPWISGSLSAARLDYRASLRDGWRYEAGVGAGKRVTDSWDLRATYRYQHRTADRSAAVVPGISGAVFDLQSHSAGLSTEYALTETLSLAGAFDYRRGDVTSTTLRNFSIFTHSDAIALDPVFGADTVAYRIFALTRAWRLGASYALGRTSSLNVGAERWISRAGGGLDYYNTLIGASYVQVF